MLAQVRQFFSERHICEVDSPSLSTYPALDAHIDVMTVQMTSRSIGYLHTSPEYAMKKLLSKDSGDIYYLGHVFRREESGRLHRPEFTMIEWYRLGFSLEQMIQETAFLMFLFLKSMPIEMISYRDLFLKYLNIDPHTALIHELKDLALKKGLTIDLEEKDDYLHLLLSHEIEPHLGKGKLTAVTDYPPSQAALAKITEKDKSPVAERFEIYHQGIELANGYHELTSARDQKKRFEEENEKRRKMGKETYPIDEEFIAALESGLPECCGVSVGFDRLILLQQDLSSIAAIYETPMKDCS